MFTVISGVICKNGTPAGESTLQDMCSMANGISGLLGYNFEQLEKPEKFVIESETRGELSKFMEKKGALADVIFKRRLPPPNMNEIKFTIKVRFSEGSYLIVASKNTCFEKFKVHEAELENVIDTYLRKGVINGLDVYAIKTYQ
jgi:hypothetical protein